MNKGRWLWLGWTARWALLPAMVLAALVLFPPWSGRITGGGPHAAGAVEGAEAPLAFYAYRPAGAGGAGWLTPMIRMLDAAGLVRPEDQPVADGVLIASLLNGYPHRVALLDLHADRFEPGQLDVRRLRLVVEVDAPGAFESIRRSLETVLGHYSQPGAIAQTIINLPDGRQGVRYRDANWPAWLTLEWSANEKGVLFGIGQGVLTQWLRQGDAIGEHPAATAHRQARTTGANEQFHFEAFVDLSAMRRAAPTLFQTGRTTPLLQLFALHRTDHWMMHGSSAGSFLLLDVTTHQRGRTHTRRLTRDVWPTETGVPQPPGSFHVAAPIDWVAAARRIQQVVRLAHEPEDRPLFDEAMAQFAAASGVQPEQAVENLQPWLLIADYPRAWLALPGTVTLYAPLRPEVSPALAGVGLRRVMAPLVMGHTDPAAVGVAHDPRTELYWLDSPMRALFKAPAWGWFARPDQPGVFVISFSPQAVQDTRRWLGVNTSQ